MSFLFHKTHEQSYVAHAAAFSLCVGPYKSHEACFNTKHPRSLRIPSSSIHHVPRQIIILSMVLVWIYSQYLF